MPKESDYFDETPEWAKDYDQPKGDHNKEDDDYSRKWSGQDFIKLHKAIIQCRQLTGNDKIILCCLIDFKHFLNQLFTLGVWFFITTDELQWRSGCPRRSQYDSIKHMEQLGFLDVNSKGYPSKRYIKINWDSLDGLEQAYKRNQQRRRKEKEDGSEG